MLEDVASGYKYVAMVLYCQSAGFLIDAALDLQKIFQSMFFTVSIPMADKRQSAKPGYAEYKAATRSLLPIPK